MGKSPSSWGQVEDYARCKSSSGNFCEMDSRYESHISSTHVYSRIAEWLPLQQSLPSEQAQDRRQALKEMSSENGPRCGSRDSTSLQNYQRKAARQGKARQQSLCVRRAVAPPRFHLPAPMHTCRPRASSLYIARLSVLSIYTTIKPKMHTIVPTPALLCS